MSDAYSSTSYFYSSTTNTGDSGSTTGHRYSTASTTDREGNTIVRSAHQDMGKPAVIEERRYDRLGQELLLQPTEVSSLSSTAEGVQQRITDLDEEQITYGDDSGMTLYALGSQDRMEWDKGIHDPGQGAAADSYESGSGKVQFEDPSTGARLRRSSDVEMASVST